MRLAPTLLICLAAQLPASAAQRQIDFAADVAPILADHCLRCHSPGVSKADLSLATIKDLLEQQLVVPGDPEASYLLELIEGVNGESPEMPKDAPALSQAQVDTIRQWILSGAVWPEEIVVREKPKADHTWWSLQPIVAEHGEKTIDDFVEAALARQELRMNPPANRLNLIRRATYDLIGLPPTPEEVDDFVNDTDPLAYQKLVDRLLVSPHYGERWARHWLDVVRFGESNGFERNVINNTIWPFRDYVIRSLNEDKPMDRFIREHIAGDVIAADSPKVAVGSAFLVAGTYDDVGNQDAAQAAQIRANTLDEIIRATGEAFLGLTLGCARCHDHKFDPILQSDYYAFYATFAGIKHGAVTLATPEQKRQRANALKPLEKRKQEITSGLDELDALILKRARDRIADYRSQWTRPAADRRGTIEEFPPVKAKFVRLVCEARDSALRSASGFRIDEFEVRSAEVNATPPRNVALESQGAKATGKARHIEDFPGAYAPRLAIDGRTGARFIAADDSLTIELAEATLVDRVTFSSARGAEKPEQGKFAFVAEYRIEVSNDGAHWQEVAHGRDRQPTSYASNPTHEEFRLLKLETTSEELARRRQLRKASKEIERAIREVPELPSVWIGRRDAPDANGPFHVFLGGSPQKRGEPVGFRSMSTIRTQRYSLPDDAPESERRRELAAWITSTQNPLTARVLANRLWHYHFGRGIVDTPSDFGYMGGRPTHPALLDFLAAKLISHGWRWKPMHRMIMLSKVYRQSSAHVTAAAKVDGDARWLWRFPPRRLSAEEIRDTMLSIAGKLTRTDDPTNTVPDGGPGFRLYHFMQDNVCTYVPLDQHGQETYRRAIYHQNARASVVDLMSDFDQPDCALGTPTRSETTTPLQALTVLNHSFTLDMANAMTLRLGASGSRPEDQVRQAYRLCFGRVPSADELRSCVKLATEYGMSTLCRVLLNTSELIYVR